MTSLAYSKPLLRDLVSLDFETFYSTEYSLALAKYNTSEYIRDEQFLIHGCGFQYAGRKPYWVTGHDEALRECQELGLDQRPVNAHNIAFDGFILHEHADIHCGFYCDTLSMARATMGHHIKHNLDSVADHLGLGRKTKGLLATKGLRRLSPAILRKLSTYCINDVVLCQKILEHLIKYMPDKEMDLIDLTLRMFCTPQLLVDTDLAESEYELEIVNKRAAVAKAKTEKSILMSNDKFADLLRSLGVEPPLKISPRTGKTAYAFAKTDPGFKRLLGHKDEAVKFAVDARMQTKSTINETRARRLYFAGQDGSPLPVLLNYAGAHTFRWSGGNKLNLQNLPRKGALRRAILAPLAHQIVVCDLSQIEARFTVWLAGQLDVLAAFAAADAGQGASVYRLMAAKIYGKKPDAISDLERFIGKICVLGLGFGMGWKKLRMTLAMGSFGPPVDISEADARHIVNVYRRANSYVVQLWDKLNVLLQHMATRQDLNYKLGPVTFRYKMIELPSGLALKYPGLIYDGEGCSYMSRYGRTSIWGGGLLENIVQALARCHISNNMLTISKKCFVASMSHDEIIAIAPNAEADLAYAFIHKVMVTRPSWAPDIPLAAEGGYARNYSK